MTKEILQDKLLVQVILVEKADSGPGDSRFEFAIRWLLGDKSELPKPDDSFDVTIELNDPAAGPRYLGVNGQFVLPGDKPFRHPVSPKNDAMLAPPRRTTVIPYGDHPNLKWTVADIPRGPVDCDTNKQELAIDEAFGVCHLLSESQEGKAQFRAAKAILPAFEQAIVSIRSQGQSFRSVFDDSDKNLDVRSEAAKLAKALVENLASAELAPTKLKIEVIKQFAKFQKYANLMLSDNIPQEKFPWDDIPIILRPVFSTDWLAQTKNKDRDEKKIIKSILEYNKLLFLVAANETVLAEAEEELEAATNTRHQIRLRAVSGGHLVDYWCHNDPVNCTDADRGVSHAASYLIGTGLNVGNFSKDDVQQWLNKNAGSNDSIIKVTVKHNKPQRIFNDSKDLLDRFDGTFATLAGDREYVFPESIKELLPHLRAPDLKSALDNGTSHPLVKPNRAYINYDLIQSSAGEAGKELKSAIDDQSDQNNYDIPTEREISYQTGENKLTIVIDNPAPPSESSGSTFTQNKDPDPHRGQGVNVYGIWRNLETETYFKDETALQGKIDLATLRKWLVNKRYSFKFELEGAFDSEHDNLKNIITSPPWNPIFARADQVIFDPETGQPKQAMPTVLNDNNAVFGIDLRAGFSNSADKFIGWDLRDLPDNTWTPGALRRSYAQQYRFWVTNVDLFEQESQPQAVLASDLDAGEAKNYIYTPKYRANMVLPSADVDDAKTGVRLEIRRLVDEKEGKLEVYWQLPTINEIGSNVSVSGGNSSSSPASQFTIAHDQVLANILLLRKPFDKIATLDREVVAKKSRYVLLADSSFNKFSAEPWKTEIRELTNDQNGWQVSEFSTVNLVHKQSGQQAHSFPFTHVDRGYEYIALINFEIKRGSTLDKHWFKDTENRTVQFIEKVDPDNFKLIKKSISELTRTSGIISTTSRSLVNTERPKAASLENAFTSKNIFHWARPVLPVPGLSRDLILSNLGSLNVIEGLKSGAISSDEDWAKTGIKLTPGQEALVESSLQRVCEKIGIPSDVETIRKDPRLKTTRLLMAQEFLENIPAESKTLENLSKLPRLNPNIGFRGLVDVKWQYQPIALDPASADPNESESILFKIYGIQIPIARKTAREFATINVATKVESEIGGKANLTFEFKDIISSAKNNEESNREGIDAITFYKQPTVIRIQGTDTNEFFFGSVEKINVLDTVVVHDSEGNDVKVATKWKFNVNLFDTEVIDIFDAKRYLISFFVAQPVVEFKMSSFSVESSYREFLPIGGGNAQFGAWCLSSVSAQSKETENAKRQWISKRLPSSVEPITPTNFKVSAPVAAAHFLEPAKHLGWVPDAIKDRDTAQRASRLVLSWQSLGGDNKTGIAIEREQKVFREDRAFGAMNAIEDEYEALTAIENADQKINSKDLKIIRKSWLLGARINPESSKPISDLEHITKVSITEVSDYLGIDSGRKTFSKTNSKEIVGFVDYYRNLRTKADNNDPMDTSRLYRYRAFSYVNLDPDGSLGIDKDSRYLMSRPTQWSNYRLPQAPAIKICKNIRQAESVTTSAPAKIIFNFSTKSSLFKFATSDIEHTWLYRAIIQRKSKFTILSGEGQANFEWLAVGKPISFKLGNIEPAEVIDEALFRDDIGEEPTFTYRVQVHQYYIEERDGVLIEQLIAAPEEIEKDKRIETIQNPIEFDVRLRSATFPETQEVLMTVELTVK